MFIWGAILLWVGCVLCPLNLCRVVPANIHNRLLANLVLDAVLVAAEGLADVDDHVHLLSAGSGSVGSLENLELGGAVTVGETNNGAIKDLRRWRYSLAWGMRYGLTQAATMLYFLVAARPATVSASAMVGRSRHWSSTDPQRKEVQTLKVEICVHTDGETPKQKVDR